MIEVHDLRKSFGRHLALRGVSFTVPRGQIAGFLGPNGAGKTTTMRILAGSLPVDQGRACVAGFDVARDPAQVQKRLGFLPESVPVYAELRLREYLAFRALVKGIPGRRRAARIDAVIESCGLKGAERKLLGALSRGFRQRVGLADALLSDPEVLILDEPTAGLDPRQVAEVRNLITGFRGQRTVLLSSHQLGEIEQVCDQIVIVAAGRVCARESRQRWAQLAVGAGRLRLVIAQPPADVQSALGALPSVESVTPTCDGFNIQSRDDARGAVFELAKQRGWRLLELSSQGLEDYYLRVTAAAEFDFEEKS
ncbi:MAG: ABC transporter ATP-binding protein [Planctomycetota bacterium]